MAGISGQPGTAKGGTGTIPTRIVSFSLESGKPISAEMAGALRAARAANPIGTGFLPDVVTETSVTVSPVGAGKPPAALVEPQPPSPFAKAAPQPGPVRASEKPSGPIFVEPLYPLRIRRGSSLRERQLSAAPPAPPSEAIRPDIRPSLIPPGTDTLGLPQSGASLRLYQQLGRTVENVGLAQFRAVLRTERGLTGTVSLRSAGGGASLSSGLAPRASPLPSAPGYTLQELLRRNAVHEIVSKLSTALSVLGLTYASLRARQKGATFIPFVGEVRFPTEEDPAGSNGPLADLLLPDSLKPGVIEVGGFGVPGLPAPDFGETSQGASTMGPLQQSRPPAGRDVSFGLNVLENAVLRTIGAVDTALLGKDGSGLPSSGTSKLGGSSTNDTIVAPDNIGGKLGQGNRLSNKSKDAHYPDITGGL